MFPKLASNVAIALNNIMFWPIYNIEPFEDYSIVGIEVKLPKQ